jgi:hypothetical protein
MAENGFNAAMTRSLRDAGLAGRTAAVALDRRGLTLAGAEGGFVSLPRAEIACVRFERVDGEGYSNYIAWIWREGAERPLKLMSVRGERLPYAQAMRALAAEMRREGRGERVWIGSSKGSALFLPAVGGLVMAGGSAAVLLSHEAEPWWQPGLAIAIFAAIFAFLSWYAAARLWPRPLADEAALKRYLPR